MKITLPKSELEKFLNLSSYLKISNESISFSPITEYILVNIKNGFCKFTLTTTGNFVTYMFSTSHQTQENFLLSYTELKKFYSSKRSDNLIITETKISDGTFNSKHIVKDDIKIELFPSVTSISGLQSKRISKATINQILVSKKYIKEESKDKLIPTYNHSNILGKQILSSDGFISFLYSLPIEENLEFIFFSSSEIDLIRNFEYFDYIKTDNWNIIKYKTIVFGKRLIEGVSPAFFPLLKRYIEILKKDVKITIPVERFYDFCKTVKTYTKDETVNSYLTILENGIRLSYTDHQNAIELDEIISCNQVGFEVGYRICFTQSVLLKVFDSLGSDYINLSECVEENGNKGYIGFWLDSDPNFHSICSKGFELQKQDVTETL